MTVTIKDVAARAGVSPKTVSRVMNGEPHVRAAVRDAVMLVVEALGYRPNAFARSLSSARSYLLGLFCDDPTSGYATALHRGALLECRRRHYHLIVEPLALDMPGWAGDFDANIMPLKLDGAILAPPLSQNQALLDHLAACDLPYVRISPEGVGEAPVGLIEIDEERAAHDMTAHLIALGHREIGFIEGDPRHASTRTRRAGFVAAMRDAGLPVLAGRIAPGDFSFRSGLEAGEAMLAGGLPPTAIFASNDDMALGVSVAAIKLGLSVPRDVSIAGFDDAPTARLAWPAITTVHQPVLAMGAAAVRILCEPGYRDAPSDARFRERLHYNIVWRESTAGR